MIFALMFIPDTLSTISLDRSRLARSEIQNFAIAQDFQEQIEGHMKSLLQDFLFMRDIYQPIKLKGVGEVSLINLLSAHLNNRKTEETETQYDELCKDVRTDFSQLLLFGLNGLHRSIYNQNGDIRMLTGSLMESNRNITPVVRGENTLYPYTEISAGTLVGKTYLDRPRPLVSGSHIIVDEIAGSVGKVFGDKDYQEFSLKLNEMLLDAGERLEGHNVYSLLEIMDVVVLRMIQDQYVRHGEDEFEDYLNVFIDRYFRSRYQKKKK